MKEIEASRMNFLGHGKIAFTYMTMIFLLVLWCAFLVFIYKLYEVRESRLNEKILSSRATLAKFTTEKETQLKAIEEISTQQRGKSAVEELSEVFSRRPHWSGILWKMTKSLPSQVWLDEVSITPEKDYDWRMDIKGKAKSQRALMAFITRLEAGGIFRQTELVGTKRTSDGDENFSYEVSTKPVVKK